MENFKDNFNNLLLTNNNIKSLYYNALSKNYDLDQILKDNNIKSYSTVYYSKDTDNLTFNKCRELKTDLDKDISSLNYNFKALKLPYWVKYDWGIGLKFYYLFDLAL